MVSLKRRRDHVRPQLHLQGLGSMHNDRKLFQEKETFTVGLAVEPQILNLYNHSNRTCISGRQRKRREVLAKPQNGPGGIAGCIAHQWDDRHGH